MRAARRSPTAASCAASWRAFDAVARARLTAARQADHARQEADQRLADLAFADRRHKRAEETRRGLATSLTERANRRSRISRGQSGTDLE
jgi:cytochrome c-type biogenesis protein CcmH/NrfG